MIVYEALYELEKLGKYRVYANITYRYEADHH
jgi:hypothetical protein